MSSPAPTLYACSSFTEAGDCAAWVAVPPVFDYVSWLSENLPTVEQAGLLVGAMFVVLGMIHGLKRILKPDRMVS